MRFSASLLAAAALAAAGTASPSGPARAQAAVACVNCSTWTTQLWERITSLEAQATRLASRATQLRDHALRIQNTINLPSYVWGQIQNDTQQVRNLFSGARYGGLGVSSVGYGVAGAAGQAGGLMGAPSAYGHWYREANRSYDHMERLLGRQQQGQRQERPAIGVAQQQVSGAGGAVQATAGHAQLTALGVNEQARTTTAVQLGVQQQVNQARLASEQQQYAQAQLAHLVHGGPPAQMRGNRRY